MTFDVLPTKGNDIHNQCDSNETSSQGIGAERMPAPQTS